VGVGVKGQSENPSDFIPQLDAVLESLAEEIEGWAAHLGVAVEYADPVLGEGGRHEWAVGLRKQVDWAVRTTGTLLAARDKVDLAEDLRRRVEELCAAAEGYEQRLEALEDQRRVHVEGIVARYRQAYGDEDPDAVRLMRLCQGIDRVWTLEVQDQAPEMPEEFAEAIDRAWFEEEMQRRAGELAEHVRLLAGLETGQASGIAAAAEQAHTSQTEPASQREDAQAEDEQFGGPEEDPFDLRVVRWVGKRLYLGPEGSQVRELFMLLARKPGVPHSLFEVQLAVDGTTTMRDTHGEDAFRKSMNRIAKALSKLRKHLRENELDDHVVIIKEGPRDQPSYTLISRFGNS
jgi:hypothetical protein